MGVVFFGLGCLCAALCFEPFRFRFNRLIEWIIEPRSFWFGLLSALIVTVLFRYTNNSHDQAFQYAGLTLQLFGISAVARGISQKLSTFGKTGLRAWFVNWRRQFLGIFRRPERSGIALAATMGAASSLIAGSAHAWQKPSSLDELAELLRTELIRLDVAIEAGKKALECERQERTAADEKNRQTLEEKIAQAHAMTEKAMVGSFRDEIVGVIWLALGTICATIPKEIAAWW
jgi:hypothetical protein